MSVRTAGYSIHEVMVHGIIQGTISVNEVLELPSVRETRSVKSIQMFKAPVQRAVRGDRVGICVTQLDPGLLERGLACSPGTVPTFRGAIAAVEKIRFYAGACSRAVVTSLLGHLCQGRCVALPQHHVYRRAWKLGS